MHDDARAPDVAARRVLSTRARAFVNDDLASVRTLTLAPSDDARAIAGKLGDVDVVVVRFAKPSEGRPYTQARILREELGYKGRVRAAGDVVVDALGFMHRAGIDEMILRDESDEAFALAALDRFSVRYQGDALDARPLHRRVRR